MNFIDNNGHIFSLQSYSEKPIGYEYDEHAYIFWMNDNNQNFLSINNFYIKVINILIPVYDISNSNSLDDILDINISIDSNKFFLLSSLEIQNLINSNKDIKDIINIDVASFKKNLTNNDLVLYRINEEDNNYALLPLYVIGTSDEEGSWYTNILINIYNKYSIENKYLLSEKEINDENYNYVNVNGSTFLVKNEWSFITIGGIFKEDNEPLYINGKNMGVNLPKDILKSIYQCSYINEEFNFQLYNEKLKEYILNFMNIKGELGNYRSLENSLKWFGYSDKLSLSKLLQTDNQFKNQFIRDYFNIDNDILQSFQTFRNSTYISLVLKLNEELNESYDFNFEKEFYGEGHPKLESLIDKYVIKHDEVNEHFNYIVPYYDYSFTELGLKLSCLKYYFKKYFMPIHLSIMSLSMSHKVYLNDIKMIFGDNVAISEKIEYITDTNDIEFSKNNELYFTKQIHYVDDILNEYKGINETNSDWYYINDTCVNIPIKFKNFDKPYNCTLLLERELNNVDDYHYFINFNLKTNILNDIKIYDINKKLLDNESLYFGYSFDLEKYSIYYKGYSNLINAIKSNKKEEVQLEYEIIDVINNKLNYYFIYDNVKINIENEEKLIKIDDSYLYVPSINDININPMNICDAICNIYYSYDFYLRIKYWDDDIYKIIINNTNNITLNKYDNYNFLITETPYTYIWENEKYSEDIFFITEDEEMIILEDEYEDENKLKYIDDLITINFLPSSELLYESHFYVCQNKLYKETIYNNFIIYPKIINKNKDISYWINNKFKIKLLVNDKWYFYDFILKIPEPIVKLGKLKYNYWENENRYLTNFSQIKEIKDDRIIFKSFMYNPELINVNHINFHTDNIKYALNNNLMYISGNLIQNEFYYSFILNDQIIRISLHTYKSNFYVDYKYLSELNKTLYIYENNDNEYFSLEDTKKSNIYVYASDNATYILTQHNDNIGEDSEFIIDDQINSIILIYFEYNKSNDTYSMYKIVDDEKILLTSNLNIRINYNSGNIETFLNKYSSEINIFDNKEYLNNIILYDLYKKNKIYNEKYILTNNSIINCKGIDFYFDNYNYDNKGYPVAKIYVSGTVQQNIDDYQKLNKEFIDLYNNKEIDIVNVLTNKSINISTDKDFNVYSINWNDMLCAITYFYYESIKYENNEIIGTKNYTTKPYSVIYNKDYKYYGYKYYNSLNEISKLENNIKLDEYSKLGEKYKDIRYINNCEVITENNEKINKYLLFEENRILDKIYKDEYDIIFKTEYYLTSTNELYIPTNLEFENFYKDIQDNKDNKYKIKVIFYIKDGYKKNNIVHDYFGYSETINNKRIGYINNEGDFILSSSNKYGAKQIELMKKVELVYKDLTTGDKSLINDNDYINSCKNIPYYYPGAHWYTINETNSEYEFYDMVNLLYSNSEDIEEEQYEKIIDNFWIYNYFAKRLDIEKLVPFDENGNITSINGKIDYKYDIKINDVSNENICIKPCVYIRHNDDTETIYNGNDLDLLSFEFELKSDDKIAYIFFQIINVKDGDNISGWIEPKFYFSENKFEKLKYNSSLYSKNLDCKININGKEYYYGDNGTEEVIKLYKEFFKEEYVFYNYAMINNEIYASSYGLPKIYSQNINLIDTYLDYDFYLMHDYEYWYVIYISKDTINKISSVNDLIIQNKNKELTYTSDTNNMYKLKYVKSNNSFLINRMKYVPSNGINHFINTDIIVANLETNNRLPVDIFNNTKWNIEPLSIGVSNISNNNILNTEMTIIPLSLKYNKYQSGYYNISVRYNLDKYNQHQFKKIVKILIK